MSETMNTKITQRLSNIVPGMTLEEITPYMDFISKRLEGSQYDMYGYIYDSRNYAYTIYPEKWGQPGFITAGCHSWNSWGGIEEYYTEGSYQSNGNLLEIKMIIEALWQFSHAIDNLKYAKVKEEKWLCVLCDEEGKFLRIRKYASVFSSLDKIRESGESKAENVVGFFERNSRKLVSKD